MALLPGDGSPWHSRVLTWEGAGTGKGAELGWNQGADGCAGAPFSLTVIGSWNPGANIFCGGHTHLLAGTTPELLSVGGHAFSLGPPGIPDSRTFVPGTGSDSGSWTGPPSRPRMQQARFYPTVTTLGDGRAAVTGGQAVAQAWFFGGRVNGNPPATGTGDSLLRYGRGGADSGWDLTIYTQASNQGERPTPREGHSTTSLSSLSASVHFGGRNGSGSAVDDETWLLRREDGGTLATDYTYRWEKLQLHATSPKPIPRSEHTAVSVSPTEMIVFGGTQTAGQEFWRLYKEGNAWHWQTVTATSGTGPAARFGHAAVYQDNRMIVFGGSTVLGGTAADNGVYAFDFTGGGFSQGTWSQLTVAAGPGPGPRRDHTMVLHSGSTLLVYGGHLGGGAPSDTLWKLVVSGTSAVWSQVATNGPTPGPRANHAAFYDAANGNLLYIFGGEPAPSAAVDKYTYVIEPLPSSGTAMWVRGAEAANLLAGHTADGDIAGVLHARRPEIYNRGANTWTPQSNSGWLPTQIVLEEYPVQFVVPGSTQFGGGGRLIRVGADPVARYLDIPVTGLASGWQEVRRGDPPVPLSSVPPLKPYTGVLYQPGKILVVGSRVEPTVAAKSLDANEIGTADWVAEPGGARSHDLNLVVLPNGQVLALGGLDAFQGYVRCPQLWTPGSGTAGTWTDAGTGLDYCTGCALECEPVARDYHSTAMLLPDGRVVTGGGTETSTTTELRVFCPPYLDEEQEWTTRPQITLAPASLAYGEAFIIGKQSTDSIATACLIRPAATTHGFDQNQRFVPLTLEWKSATELRALAPARGSIAPPGFYLLFIVNQNGVPAVARWIRLSNCPTVPCDHEPPPVVNDLSPDIVGPNEIWLAWSAPGDDRNPALGAYDMRFSTSQITSENAFASATQVGAPYPPPTPGSVGSGQSCAQLGLSPSTPYHFALKTRDGASNWSPKATLTVSTGSSGGGGGGFSAVRMEGRVEGGSPAGDAATASAIAPGSQPEGSAGVGDGAVLAGAASLAPAAGMLVAETRRLAAGGWEVTLRRVAEPEGFDPALGGAIVSQIRSQGGAWKTLGRHQPSAGQNPLGLCALRNQGRVVFPAGYVVERVASGLQEDSQELALSVASHSRLGSLGDQFLTGDGTVEMELGDALTLTYTPGSTALAGAASWYLLVRADGSQGPATPARRGLSSRVPSRFALHQNQPNPFRNATGVVFDLPVASPVTLEVFDLLGRKVATLAHGERPAGTHTIEWDLRDARGGPVRPGVYVCRLVAGDFRARTKDERASLSRSTSSGAGRDSSLAPDDSMAPDRAASANRPTPTPRARPGRTPPSRDRAPASRWRARPPAR